MAGNEPMSQRVAEPKVAVFRAQLPGLAAGEQECIPVMYRAAIAGKRGALSLCSTCKSSVARLPEATPPIHSSERAPAADRRELGVENRASAAARAIRALAR